MVNRYPGENTVRRRASELHSTSVEDNKKDLPATSPQEQRSSPAKSKIPRPTAIRTTRPLYLKHNKCLVCTIFCLVLVPVLLHFLLLLPNLVFNIVYWVENNIDVLEQWIDPGTPASASPTLHLDGPDHAMIDSRYFYGQYHGHPVEHLQRLEILARENNKSIAWFVGDSTLDNKYWLHEPRQPARNGFEKVLQPAKSVQDVGYWVNRKLEEAGLRGEKNLGDYLCLNAAVEESTLGSRQGWFSSGSIYLNEHDQLVR